MTGRKYGTETLAALQAADEFALTAEQRASIMELAHKHGLNEKQAVLAYYYALSGDMLASFFASDYKQQVDGAPALARRLANRILCQPHVMKFVYEVQRLNSLSVHIDRAFITNELLQCLYTAKLQNKLPQMRQILQDLAKLHGLVVDKAEIDATHQFQVMKTVTLDGVPLEFNIGSGKPVEHDTISKVIDATPTPEGLPAVQTNDITDLI